LAGWPKALDLLTAANTAGAVLFAHFAKGATKMAGVTFGMMFAQEGKHDILRKSHNSITA
jgi:hypothetical protein